MLNADYVEVKVLYAKIKIINLYMRFIVYLIYIYIIYI